MSRSDDLFQRLRAGGVEALNRLLADAEPESYFLDFKTTADDGTSNTLNGPDNRNLSKAISGFGNTSGGLIIWGIDCRRDRDSGVEIPNKAPVRNARAFASKIQSAISRTTIPPHSFAEVLFIPEADGSESGYVILHVPQSAVFPLRSLATNHYHLRSGSDFGILPHDVLAAMLGKRPSASLDLNFGAYPVRRGDHPDTLFFGFEVHGVNLGQIYCERPFLTLTATVPVATNILVRASESFSMRPTALPLKTLISKQDIVVPPGGTERICEILCTLPVPCADLRFELAFGGQGTLPRRCLVEASGADLTEIYRTNTPVSSDTVVRVSEVAT